MLYVEQCFFIFFIYFLNFSPKISNFFNYSAHHGARHGWKNMLWRIWEKHGSCGNPVWLIFLSFCFFKQMCSAWWLVLFMLASSSTWWLSSLLAQPGEAAQLMARWGPMVRGGSVDSCAQHGWTMEDYGCAGLVYLARLHGWWSRLHGGLVEDLQK
ncbi:unnamed protein product [Meloidogyne enterolobii]|uniref:Uncharacterized protein n=1 Tax=Meloidogyne enterolobii TaxID=390850 RepID=A0ACB0Z8J8_MELEN